MTEEETDIVAPSSPQLLAVHVKMPENLRFEGKPWRTSIYKAIIPHRVWLDTRNLAGDDQANKKFHGGPDKAVCCFSSEHFPYWRKRFTMEKNFDYGAFGENFTVSGMTEERICIGDVYAVGTALVQISQPRQPCINLARRWKDPDIPEVMKQIGHSGFYLRVLRPGEVGACDALTLTERPNPTLTVDATNRARYRKPGDRPSNDVLASLPELSEDWRATFRRRMRVKSPAS